MKDVMQGLGTGWGYLVPMSQSLADSTWHSFVW